MDELQVTNYGLCGECKYHKYFCLRSLDFMGITIEEWYCDNRYSKKSGQITNYTDTCDKWEKEE